MLPDDSEGSNIPFGAAPVKSGFHVKPSRDVSRETPSWAPGERPASGDLAPPARRLDDQIVQIAGGNAGNPRRLRQGAGAHPIELLPRLGRETLKLEVGKLGGQREGGQ